MFVSHTAHRNIAKGKPTHSSPNYVSIPELVDGLDTVFVEVQPDKWVAVDLGQTEHIQSVRLRLKMSKIIYS